MPQLARKVAQEKNVSKIFDRWALLFPHPTAFPPQARMRSLFALFDLADRGLDLGHDIGRQGQVTEFRGQFLAIRQAPGRQRLDRIGHAGLGLASYWVWQSHQVKVTMG